MPLKPTIPLSYADFSAADRARFAAFIDKTDRCWMWRGAKTQWGYGVFTHRKNGKKRTIGAHRLQYALRNGECPPDKVICHSCDVRACVNPDHLWAGTNDDNMSDMASKGTLKGEKNPIAKLDVWDIICIRRDPRPQRTIAKDYGVTQSCVMTIKTRRNWRHVPEFEV